MWFLLSGLLCLSCPSKLLGLLRHHRKPEESTAVGTYPVRFILVSGWGWQDRTINYQYTSLSADTKPCGKCCCVVELKAEQKPESLSQTKLSRMACSVQTSGSSTTTRLICELKSSYALPCKQGSRREALAFQRFCAPRKGKRAL